MKEHFLKLQNMRETVKKDLQHIPRGNLDQNMLRQAYSSLRMHSLGEKSQGKIGKEQVLVKAASLIKKNNPEFKPEFNEKFFDIAAACKATIENPNVKEEFCSLQKRKR